MLSELRKEWDAQQHGTATKHQQHHNTSTQIDSTSFPNESDDEDSVLNKKLRRKRKK